MPKDCCALQNVSIEIEQEEENRQFKKKAVCVGTNLVSVVVCKALYCVAFIWCYN